jgi:hypothetical protein
VNTSKRYVLGLLLLSVGPLLCNAGEPHVSFLYSLPADGVWIEFEIDGVTLVSKTAGTLRMSSVGKKTIKDASHRWIELKLDVVTETKRKQRELLFTKLLVAEKAVEEGRSLEGQIVEAYIKEGQDGPVKRLALEDIHKLARLGATASDSRLELVKDKEPIATKLGEFKTRHLVLKSKMDDLVNGAADVWLSPEVPFGCLKAEIRTIGLFKFAVTKKGKDAKSEVDESKAEN